MSNPDQVWENHTFSRMNDTEQLPFIFTDYYKPKGEQQLGRVDLLATSFYIHPTEFKNQVLWAYEEWLRKEKGASK